jgi:hypothetical protein
VRLRREALAAAAALALVISGCVPQSTTPDVDDFAFDSFSANYTLVRDADGGSMLRTVERMTAVFPETDQNRGIVRSIPVFPDVDTIGLEVVAVTDGDGVRRPFELEEHYDSLAVIVAVPEGEFVHGEQTYVITYQQRGVIESFSGDDGPQIFIWEVNGRDWRQPFGVVSVEVELAGELAGRVYNEPFCYVAADDEDAQFDCAVTGGEGFYDAEQTDLEPGESLHIAIEFQPGTFG